MKSLLNNIKNLYYKLYSLLIIYSLLNVFILFLYRYDIFVLINKKYPELSYMNFFDYIFLSLHYDSFIIIITTTLLFFLLAILRNSLKIKLYVASLFTVSQLIFFKLTSEFFRIYETTFQPGYLGNEGSTSSPEMINSGLAEFSSGFYVTLLFFSTIIIVFSIVLYLFKKNTLPRKIQTLQRPVDFLKYITPLVLFFLLVFSLSFHNEKKYYIYALHFSHTPTKQTINTLKDLTLNPLYSLFYNKAVDEYKLPGNRDFTNEMVQDFLNTDSRQEQRVFKRLNLKRNKKYNIILYFFESTASRYLDVTVNGKPVTPNWHKLRKNSFIATNHYVNNPLSATTMLSVFTSKYDINTKNPLIQNHPTAKITTISEILKNNGYRTCLLHSGDLKYANQNKFLKNKKFDRIIQLKDLKKPPFDQRVGWGLDDRALITPSIAFAEQDSTKPYFMVILPVSPHHPYIIPEEKFNITRGLKKNDFPFNSSNWLKYLNSLYYSDFVLGRIITKLEERGLMENTLLFLFADHGEAFYQHRKNYNHPFYLYEENVHVPFLIYNKHIFKNPVYYTGISRHIDILPTVLDCLGIDPHEEHEGISLFSRHKSQLAFFQTNWGNYIIGIRDGKWKYMYNVKDQTDELYDLSCDPDETFNQAGNNKKIVENYRDYIHNAKHYLHSFYTNLLGVHTSSKKDKQQDTIF